MIYAFVSEWHYARDTRRLFWAYFEVGVVLLSKKGDCFGGGDSRGGMEIEI